MQPRSESPLEPHLATQYDVAVLGGGFAGAAAALLLLRARPELKLVILDRKPSFDRGVGESTVEVSGHFLRHVLGLTDHLSRHHLSKQGLRFFFHDSADTPFAEASEVGPRQLARLPTWQLDRAVLDEHVLQLAEAAGAQVWRPARVRGVVLGEERRQQGEDTDLHRVAFDGVSHDDDKKEVAIDVRYLIDASGRAAILARPRGWVKPLKEHPTAAVWARYRGVRDLDSASDMDMPGDAPFFRSCIAPRRLATNHFTGHGYWIWAIPLANGETSLGAVWDTRMVQPVGTSPDAKLRWFLEGNPVSRFLVDGAEPVAGDCHGLGNLAFLVDRVAGPGFACVGDAAGFIDPFYSPGIDQVTFSIRAVVDMATEFLDGGPTAEHEEAIAAHDVAYRRFLRHYFDALYLDKYEVLGDYDLMTASMLIDTGLYYLTTVEPIYRKGEAGYRRPPFYNDDRGVGRWLVSFYRRRLLSISRRRRTRGTYGKRNRGRRTLFAGFALGWPARRMLVRGMLYWGRAEVEHWAGYLWPWARRRRPLPSLPFAAPGGWPDVEPGRVRKPA